MTNIRQKLDKIIRPIVIGLEYELVGIKYLPQGKHSLLRIYIDNYDKQITVDDCAKISHQISGALDVEQLLSGQYQLEVSSPGLDRPLFSLADFLKFVGNEVQLKLSQPLDKQRNISGTIESVTDDVIRIKQQAQVWDIEFGKINTANLIPKF